MNGPEIKDIIAEIGSLERSLSPGGEIDPSFLRRYPYSGLVF